MTFSIRDLLWLMVVVALVVGWGVENRRRRMTQKGHERLLLHAQELKDELRLAKSEYDDVRDGLNAELVKRGITDIKRTGDRRFQRDVNWGLADEPLPP